MKKTPGFTHLLNLTQNVIFVPANSHELSLAIIVIRRI